jgi:hypothetical protein
MRVGYARGAEALPECLSNWPSYPGEDQAEQNWLNFYADTSGYIKGLASSALFHIQTSINEAGNPIRTSYGTDEAGVSVQYVGGDGRVFGFGSQGLQYTDKENYPSCGSDWCNQFERYWVGGVSYRNTELELQQIDCSDPTTTATGLACAQNGNTSKTGDLRVLLPFATQEHMTILELYDKDALLAYDPNYCKYSGGAPCVGGTGGDTFSNLDGTNQYNFYQNAGQGASCSGGAGTGTGDCSYATFINAAHGYH